MATSKMSVKTSVRTVYGSLVMNALRWNTKLRILPNSTLNQKFKVQADALPYDTEKVTTQYFVLGVNGLEYVPFQDMYMREWRYYSPTQAALYRHIPLVMRRLTEPLSIEERKDLRLRTIESHNGVDYECWYARLTGHNDTPAEVEKRTEINGVISPDAWSPSLNDLNPNPQQLPPDSPVENGRTYQAVTKKFQIHLSPGDIQELLNSAQIKFGDANLANITELGICSGVDRRVPGDFNGIQQNYVEAIYTQINDFMRVDFSAADSLAGKDLELDAGTSEPNFIENY